MKDAPTLDEWVEKNALNLANQLLTHLEVYDVADPGDPLRLLMISVRNWNEERNP